MYDGDDEIHHHHEDEPLEQSGQQTAAFRCHVAILTVQFGFLRSEQFFNGFLEMMSNYRYLKLIPRITKRLIKLVFFATFARNVTKVFTRLSLKAIITVTCWR